jgi:hypothetical protein
MYFEREREERERGERERKRVIEGRFNAAIFV